MYIYILIFYYIIGGLRRYFRKLRTDSKPCILKGGVKGLLSGADGHGRESGAAALAASSNLEVRDLGVMTSRLLCIPFGYDLFSY